MFSSTLYFRDYSDRESIHNRINKFYSKGIDYRKIHRILIKEGFKIGRSPSCVNSMIEKMEERKRILSQRTEIRIGKVDIEVY